MISHGNTKPKSCLGQLHRIFDTVIAVIRTNSCRQKHNVMSKFFGLQTKIKKNLCLQNVLYKTRSLHWAIKFTNGSRFDPCQEALNYKHSQTRLHFSLCCDLRVYSCLCVGVGIEVGGQSADRLVVRWSTKQVRPDLLDPIQNLILKPCNRL